MTYETLWQDQPYHPLGHLAGTEVGVQLVDPAGPHLYIQNLGHLAGTEVGVQPSLSGQDILIRRSEVSQRLACLLSPVAAEMDRLGETLYWRIPHDREVDQLLTELIDLFISIRYSHPTLVQLELDLEALEP
jgi:hypothetical protein